MKLDNLNNVIILWGMTNTPLNMKPIIGCPNYFANEQGEIWSFKNKTPKKLKTHMGGNGYLQCSPSNNGVVRVYPIHRLIAMAFFDIPEGYVVNHKDGNKLNNVLSNLEVVTHKENIEHAIKMGLKKPRIFTEEQKQAHSEMFKGRENTWACEKLNKPMYKKDKQGNIIKEYSSVAEAGRDIGKPPSALTECANGIKKTAYGYVWEYKN